MRADRLLVTAQLGRNRTRAVKQAGDARHLSLQRGGGLRDKAAEPLVIARRVQVLQRRPLQRDPGRHPLVEHRRGAEIGRASRWARGCQYVSRSVVAVSINQKNKRKKNRDDRYK